MARLFVSGKTVSIVPEDGESSVTTDLKTLLTALKECMKSESVFDLKSWPLGRVEKSSKIRSRAFKAVRQKITKNCKVNKEITGVKLYLPVASAEWLKLRHGDEVVIENAVIDGEKVLVIRRVKP